MSDLNNLFRPHIRQLKGYQSAQSSKKQTRVWLSANELPEAIVSADSQLNRYPEAQPKNIIDAYANYSGVKESELLVTRGADEGIELLIRAFCEPQQDQVLSFAPTYGMYKVSCDIQNVRYDSVPLIPSTMAIDWDAFVKALNENKTKLVFLCNPNNPTGTAYGLEAVAKILALLKNDQLLVVDEAYIEFSERESAVTLLKEYKNLIVLRTLSKAFGLAGARCGFVLAHDEIIQGLSRIIAPYPIPSMIESVVIKSFDEEAADARKQWIQRIKLMRETFIEKLESLKNIETVPSQANYIFVRGAGVAAMVSAATQAGIAIRSFQYDNTLTARISIGSELEMQSFEEKALGLLEKSCMAERIEEGVES